jgi:hypothetical protein
LRKSPIDTIMKADKVVRLWHLLHVRMNWEYT